ncbi:MAG: S1 family peptidase [Mycobacteriales bacterium]
MDPDAAAALAHQQGISTAEAVKRLGQQQALGDRGALIEKSLAGRSGGSYLDATGQLVVTTLDLAGDAAALRSGARPQRVDDSSARLESIKRLLDQAASAGGAGSLQDWYVDVPTNTVVVAVTAGTKDAATLALTKLASSFGDSVRINYVPAQQAPRTTEWLVGGLQIVIPTGGLCSVGFNTRDANGRDVVLTAGHCVKTSGTVSRNGYRIGATRTANYPGDDFGTFWNSYPTFWQPSVSVYKYNNTYVSIRGQWNTPPVGATVCKSGRTTGYTCGSITALNQTVIYTGGITVSGLVRHNACVEGGDSGGSNISAGAYALGVTSGASLTAAGQCWSKVGSSNVSWYQPIGEALSANGLRLLYQP